MEKRARLRPGTLAFAVTGVVALLLYGWFISIDLESAIGGEARMEQAYEGVAALLALWIVLLILIVMDRVLGGPSWPRRAGYLLVPLAGIATLFATDYPGDPLCTVAFLGLPLLVGTFASVGHLPKRRTMLAQSLALVPLAALSGYVILLFLS